MSLSRMLNARSVAVIGASRDENKRGFQAVRSLLASQYEGRIFPINPRESTILGLPCKPSILEVDEPVDAALVTTPAHTLPEIVEQCGQKGVAGLVVVAGGFGELGPRGKRLQRRIVDLASRYGMRLLGPNTSGMINVHSGLNLVGLNDVPVGDLALISQSGNMALHVITEARLKSQKGFSYYVGVGNEADIKFHEYLEFFAEDPKTRAIVMYVEGMSDGRRFLQQAYRTSRRKPIILLKGGRSTRGSRSVGSHTGALAGISEVARTAFERAGVITIESSDELFPAAEALSSLPPMNNDRVAILADGGGHATIAADLLTDHDLSIPELRRSLRQSLAQVLSPSASLINPIDVAGSTDSDPGVFADCARILLQNPSIGGLLIVGLFGGYGLRFSERLRFIEEDAAHRLGKLVRETGKPIVVHSLYKFARPHSLDLLRYYGIPVYDSVDMACKCIAVLAQYGQYLQTYQRHTNFVFNWGAGATPAGRELIAGVLRQGRTALLEHEGKQLLAQSGIHVSEDRLAPDADAAVALAAEAGGPVALKICSPQILHKSESRGVELDLEGSDAVRTAFHAIVERAREFRPDAEILGCLVSPMARAGTEVIIGTKIDPQFGPVLMFGIGGIFVELLRDVVFSVLPVTRSRARRMLGEIRSARILAGHRGRPGVDRGALVDLLVAISQLVESYPQIQELDLNPVVAHENGLTVVDVRILVSRIDQPMCPGPSGRISSPPRDSAAP